MRTDYHSHMLPGIDDGARNTQESLEMLQMAADMGVERQICTPHFYCHREQSVSTFLQKRQNAYQKIIAQSYVREIRLGAEVSLEIDVSKCEGIDKLAITGTKLILLEPTYFGYNKSMTRDIEQIAWENSLKPVIAHLHRFVDSFTKEQMCEFLGLNAVFQVNADSVENRKERKFVRELIENKREIVFGSDAHNTTSRHPNMAALDKVIRRMDDLWKASDEVFERYSL